MINIGKMAAFAALAFGISSAAVAQDIAVRGGQVHTMAGEAITDGVVVIEDGKISAVGPAASTPIPDGMKVLEAAVITPGLVDARTVVGLAGFLNQPHDQDQLDESKPLQPQLRAIDGYNPEERLVEWLRGLGVTTIHTGHGPGALVSGQTMIAKTTGETADEAAIVPGAMLAANLGPWALESGGKSPGTRSKQIAMLRSAMLAAKSGADEGDDDDKDAKPASLDKQVLQSVLAGDMPLMVTAQRSQDIMSALRLKEEFGIDLVIDGGAESYLLIDELLAAGVRVILHPTMARQYGDLQNASFTTAAKLREAGIPFALQSGYESYVPKTRVVLWEAAIAAANGLAWQHALASVTIDAANLIGVGDRVGSLEVGKDGDIALFDGDPFEYTSHVTSVIIDGEVVSDTAM
ncbi:Imidazolonepropionase [Altererythrobacter insulae]|nr:Imidazolonepropionase [Altererythrobacter insulae]